jgi:thiamine kinase-like enzyme
LRGIEEKFSGSDFTVKTFVLRQGDSNPYNFFITNGKAMLIDWEHAKVGDAAIDLSEFILKANLNAKQKADFLRLYGANEQLQQRIELSMLVAMLGTAAWHLDRIIKIEQSILDKRLYKSKAGEEREFGRWMKQFHSVFS